MSGRQRIVLLEPASDTVNTESRSAADQPELVPAKNWESALELLRNGGCSGIVAARDTEGFDSRRILEQIATGIAVISDDFDVLWHNPAFAQLCGNGSQVGRRIYDAIGCEEIQGPDFSPFTDCLGGQRLACSRLRLQPGRHVEMTVQPLGPAEAGARGQLLCLFRDITWEVAQREKLIAIHRAGLELRHLTPEELARMSTVERIQLLKANIIQYAKRILEFKNLEVRLLDPATKRLETLLSEGMMPPAAERPLFASVEGNGVTGFVAATGASYLCSDVRTDPLYIPGAADARSSLTVPLIYRDQVIGTFNVESPEPAHFKEADREFLEVFAREIAVALTTLDLLRAEKQFGGSASVEAIVNQVSLPADEIIADAIRVLERLGPAADGAREAVQRILRNSQAIKSSIQRVGQEYGSPAANAEPTTSRLTGRRVLLVDSDPAIRRAAHRLLGRVGCDVDTVGDAHQALDLARSIQYDAILGDIRLPDANGYEFFCTMREQAPNTPIVLMTGFGYDASHSIVKARQAGLRVVLYKPFRVDRLCDAIEDALDPGAGHKCSPRLSELYSKQPIA